MILLRFILRTCRGLMLLTTLTALLSGACNAGLIWLVNEALNRANLATTALVWAFVALGVGKLVTNYVSQVVLVSFTQGAIAELRWRPNPEGGIVGYHVYKLEGTWNVARVTAASRKPMRPCSFQRAHNGPKAVQPINPSTPTIIDHLMTRLMSASL